MFCRVLGCDWSRDVPLPVEGNTTNMQNAIPTNVAKTLINSAKAGRPGEPINTSDPMVIISKIGRIKYFSIHEIRCAFK